MAIVEELVAVLGYKTEGKEQLAGFKKGLDDAAGAATKAGGSFGALAGVAAGAVMAIGTGAVLAGKKWAKMEERVTSWANTTNQSVDSMKARYLKLADDAWNAGVPLEKAASAYEKLLAQGLDPDSSLMMLPELNKYVRAAGTEAEDAANMYGTLANQYGLAGDKAKRFFEIIYAGANYGNFENKDFAQRGPGIMAAGGALFPKNESGLRAGVALTETIGQFSPGPADTDTAVRNLLGKLNAPSTWEGSKTRKGLEEILGIKYEDLKSGKVSWPQFAAMLDKHRDKLPELFPDREAQRGATWLADSTKPGARGYQMAYDATSSEAAKGSVDQGHANKMDSLSQAFQNLSTASDRAGNALGMLVSGPLGDGLNKLAGVVNAVAVAMEGLYKYLPKLSDPASMGRELGERTREWIKEQIFGKPEQGPPAPPQPGPAAPEGGFMNKLNPGQQPFDPKAVIDVTPPPVFNVTVGTVQVTVEQGGEAGARAGQAVQSAVQNAVNSASTGPNPGRTQPGPSQP